MPFLIAYFYIHIAERDFSVTDRMSYNCPCKNIMQSLIIKYRFIFVNFETFTCI